MHLAKMSILTFDQFCSPLAGFCALKSKDCQQVPANETCRCTVHVLWLDPSIRHEQKEYFATVFAHVPSAKTKANNTES